AALEFEDLVALGIGAGGAHRVEVGLGAGRDKAHLLSARHRGDDRLGKFDTPAVVGEEGGALGDPRLRRGGDLGVRGADQHRPRAEQEIDVFLAVLVPYPAAAPLADHHIARDVAKGAAGQDALRRVDQPVLDVALHLRAHALLSETGASGYSNLTLTRS